MSQQETQGHEPTQETQDWHGYLRILIRRFGAVSGAVRRLVYAFPGEFTTAKIAKLLTAVCPGLIPGEFQVADCIESMLREKRIECMGQNQSGENLYQVCEYVPWYLRRKPKAKQMKFEFVTN